MTEITNNMRGFRRSLQRRLISDEVDMAPDEATSVALAIALEHARDLARIGALVVDGPERVMAARRRAAVVQAVLDAVLADLREGGYRHTTALDFQFRVATAEAERAAQAYEHINAKG